MRPPKSHEILMFVCLQKDSKQCCDATTPQSIHTKDESKRGTAFAFIFGVNWLWRCGVTASFGVFFSWNKVKRNDKFHRIHVWRAAWTFVPLVSCAGAALMPLFAQQKLNVVGRVLRHVMTSKTSRRNVCWDAGQKPDPPTTQVLMLGLDGEEMA